MYDNNIIFYSWLDSTVVYYYKCPSVRQNVLVATWFFQLLVFKIDCWFFVSGFLNQCAYWRFFRWSVGQANEDIIKSKSIFYCQYLNVIATHEFHYFLLLVLCYKGWVIFLYLSYLFIYLTLFIIVTKYQFNNLRIRLSLYESHYAYILKECSQKKFNSISIRGREKHVSIFLHFCLLYPDWLKYGPRKSRFSLNLRDGRTYGY